MSVELFAELTAGERPELRVTLPAETQPYTPCFALKAWDDRGDEVFAEPVCLDQMFPASQPPLGQGGSAGSGGYVTAGDPALVDDTLPQGKSSGCSVSRERGSTSALVLLLGLAALSRRRKPRSAP